MNFLVLNHFLKLINNFRKKKNTQADTWQHQRVPRVLLTSARGPPNADVIMAFDDISVDLAKVDQVNGQTGSTSWWGPHVSGTESLTGGSRMLGLGKRKRKRKGHNGYWAQSRSGQLDLAQEMTAPLDRLAKATARRPAWPAAWGKAGSGIWLEPQLAGRLGPRLWKPGRLESGLAGRLR